MNTLQTLEMALALVEANTYGGDDVNQLMDALRQQIALEKQQSDEPVAVILEDMKGGGYIEWLDDTYFVPGTKFYTRPQPTDEPLCEVHICDSCGYAYQDSPPSQCDCLGDEQYTKGYIYTRPQPKREWVGLTDEEVDIESAKEEEQAYGFIQGVIWAETKLKEKNT